MGRLKHGNPAMCLSVQDSQVIIQLCGVRQPHQMWNLDENGSMKSQKYETKCLSADGYRDNILSLSECGDDKNQIWSFVMH